MDIEQALAGTIGTLVLATGFSNIGDLGTSVALKDIKRIRKVRYCGFFQLLSAFGSVAEHCLPSILKTLIAWYEKQGVEWIISEYKPSKSDSKGRSELSHVSEQEFVSGRPLPLQIFQFLKSFLFGGGSVFSSCPLLHLLQFVHLSRNAGLTLLGRYC